MNIEAIRFLIALGMLVSFLLGTLVFEIHSGNYTRALNVAKAGIAWVMLGGLPVYMVAQVVLAFIR